MARPPDEPVADAYVAEHHMSEHHATEHRGDGRVGRGSLADMDFGGRLQRLRAAMAEAGHTALLVTDRSNIRYLAGFTGSAGSLLVSSEDALLVTDGRYEAQAERELAASGVSVRVAIGDANAQLDAVAAAAGRRLALESQSISWSGQLMLAERLPDTELVSTSGIVEALRRHKDRGELSRIETAAAVADAALERVVHLVGEGVRENELAARLDMEMRLLGASGSAFETIVAAGPNAGMPHARPTGREIAKGELVVIDFGAVVDGYRSDMTRTVCAGEPGSSLAAEVVEAVAKSQAAGVQAAGPGVMASAVDKACREVIAEAGWAEAFVHGTGHGVGLDIHEAPAVSSRSADMLEESSVVTVEPGIYLPGRCGARIEDTLVVTSDGCRVVTNSSKDLVVA